MTRESSHITKGHVRTGHRKGFTLIELLVVIAIIGILSSVVLASLSTARSKGADAKVQEQLSSARAAAEIYYSSNNSYGTAGTSCTANMFADTTSGMATLSAAASYPGSVAPTCVSTGSAWAMDHILSDSTHFCVDSSGAAKNVGASVTIASGDAGC
ncbi:MAG: type II secretion system protein [Minisyncoccia bacterium]